MAVRTDPFREIDRLMNSVVGQLAQPAAGRAMPLDLYREGENFVARIDLPGVDPASIDVDVEDRTLTIRAERVAEGGEDIQWLTRERPTGTFARQLVLGQGVALENITAAYTDGVLTLTIPMAEQAKPRKIEVAHQPQPRTIEQQHA